MSDNKHTGRAFGSRGYYIALILCAAAIGITSYVYYGKAQQEEVLVREPEYIPVGTVSVSEDIPVIATQPAGETTVPSVPEQTEPAPVQKRRKIQAPVSGEAIFDYSMEALSYNTTTRDWRVHNGMDIAAEEGAPVCAAADGTVYTVYADDTMGQTVVIRHEGGYATQYASLQENLEVKPGDAVIAGQTIGYAGATALVETALGSHVHFSVTCQDKPMDPAEFLALGQ